MVELYFIITNCVIYIVHSSIDRTYTIVAFDKDISINASLLAKMVAKLYNYIHVPLTPSVLLNGGVMRPAT